VVTPDPILPKQKDFKAGKSYGAEKQLRVLKVHGARNSVNVCWDRYTMLLLYDATANTSAVCTF